MYGEGKKFKLMIQLKKEKVQPYIDHYEKFRPMEKIER